MLHRNNRHLPSLLVLAATLLSAGCNRAGNTGKPPPGVMTCGTCEGTYWVPCDGPREDCGEKTCFDKVGCVDCTPGALDCANGKVVLCNDQGEFSIKDECGAGQTCSGGACRSECEAASMEPTNQGCEFWAVDLDNEYAAGLNDAAGAPWGVVLSNASGQTAEVKIEVNDADPGQPEKLRTVKQLSIKSNSLEQVILETREVDGSFMGRDEGPGTFLSSRAFRITSTAPLVVYQFNPMAQMFSNDASLLIPTNGLGSLYRVIGYPTANPISIGFQIPGIPDHSFVTIVGVEPDTDVTVTLGGPIVGGGGIPATPKGGKVTKKLGAFDVLNLESDGIPGDLSGTLVQSNKKVVVFTGGERGIGPLNDNFPAPPDYDPKDLCCTDHLQEQLFPVTSLGKKFVITRSPVRSTGGSYEEPDILRFVGAANTAQIRTSLPAPFAQFILRPGEMKETWAQKDVIVEATEPIIIGQILVSQFFCDNPKLGGDPSLTVFPPVEQYQRAYLFLVPRSWSGNFVVVSAPKDAEVKIDGAATSAANCVVKEAGMIDGVVYEARRCPVKEGAHRMTGSAPFGITAYGYGNVGSYAFAGGAAVRKIYDPPPIQ